MLDLLEEGDSVMADRGFDIAMLRGVSLNIPPFLRGKSQLSEKELIVTRRIASLRIHVERAMKRIKNFHIVDKNIPVTLTDIADRILFVCCVPTNFQGLLVQLNFYKVPGEVCNRTQTFHACSYTMKRNFTIHNKKKKKNTLYDHCVAIQDKSLDSSWAYTSDILIQVTYVTGPMKRALNAAIEKGVWCLPRGFSTNLISLKLHSSSTAL